MARPGCGLPSGDQGDRGVSSLVRRDIHARALDVPCLTLDSLNLHDVGFIKIDVDGNELAVLRGATTLLTRDRPALFIELEARIQPIRPVVSFLAERGYKGWVLPDDTWLPLSSFDLESHQAHASHVVSQGLLRRVLAFRSPGYVRYVNSVLFLPDGPHPGRRAPRRTRTPRWDACLPPSDPIGPPARSPRSTSSWSCCAAWPTTTRTSWRTPATHWAPRSRTCARPTAVGRRCGMCRGAGERSPATARSSANRSRSTPRQIGDLSCEALLWPVPLWPDLRFEVLVAPNGAAWNEWLVRAPGAPSPSCAPWRI